MNTIKQICEDIKKQNGQAYIVGGFTRDLILNRDSKDIDVEVFGMEMETLKSILDEYGSVKEVDCPQRNMHWL